MAVKQYSPRYTTTKSCRLCLRPKILARVYRLDLNALLTSWLHCRNHHGPCSGQNSESFESAATHSVARPVTVTSNMRLAGVQASRAAAASAYR